MGIMSSVKPSVDTSNTAQVADPQIVKNKLPEKENSYSTLESPLKKRKLHITPTSVDSKIALPKEGSLPSTPIVKEEPERKKPVKQQKQKKTKRKPGAYQLFKKQMMNSEEIKAIPVRKRFAYTHKKWLESKKNKN